MAKLSLQAAATFKCAVRIPVPGGEADPVEFTFKHRSRSDLKAWHESVQGKADGDVVGDIVCGWDLEDAFTPENVARLCDSYAAAANAIVVAYFEELRGARTKN